LTANALPVTGVESIPLWVGSADRPVFAWLDLPEDGLVTGAAVVCPSMGLESAYSTRALRSLAHGLVGVHWAALRLDYAATGDSAGTWTDPGLVEEWLRNIRLGIDYVRSLGAERVGVVGLRIGATLAAAELAGGGAVDDLVLWDPCPTGRSFLREQAAFFAFRREMAVEWGVRKQGDTPGADGARTEGLVEAPGAVFSAATAAALGPVAIAGSDQTLAARELVLTRQGRKPPRPVTARLTLPHVESTEISGQEDLFGEELVTPVATVERIISWFAQPQAPLTRLRPPAPRPTATLRAPDRPDVRERAVDIGPARLFGILSEPVEAIAPSAPTVVFLNVGLLSHHGPGRLWVELARSCAARRGVRCLRVDLSGMGDSPARPGRADMRVFPVDGLEDMEDIRRAATADGAQLIVVGVCSGADHAIEMAVAAPVASICVINPALSYVQWGDSEDASASDGPPEESEERQTWGAMGPVLSRALALVKPLQGKTRWVPTPGWWFVKRWLLTRSPVRTMEDLVRSGVEILVVVGSGEARRVYRGEQRRLHALMADGAVRIEAVDHLDHSLLERTSHERVAELFGEYVARRAGELSGRPDSPALA
jgi:hypothetical protein